PRTDDPLAVIEQRVRQGLHDPAFLRGLLDTFIEYAQDAEAEEAPDRADALVEIVQHWKMLLGAEVVDLEAAEPLGARLEAERAEHEAWRLLCRHYGTWLRGRKMER